MEDKKIAYLKNRLEQALQDDSAGDVNNCYQELKDLLDGAQLAEISQKVADFNSKRSKNISQSNAVNKENIVQKIRSIKHAYQLHLKIEIVGLAGGVGAMLLAFLIIMCDEYDVFSTDSDLLVPLVLVIAILGGVMILVGTIFAFIKGSSNEKLIKCRAEVFNYMRENDSRLQKLVDTVAYGASGFYKKLDGKKAFGVLSNIDISEIYIGEFKLVKNPFEKDSTASNMLLERSGIGTLYSDDLLMKLEGEFKGGDINGVVDIQWEDGNEWHGQYKNNLPWDGKGKAYLKNKKAVIGVWKNGMKIG